MKHQEYLPPVILKAIRAMVWVKSLFLCLSCLLMAYTFVFVVVLRYGFSADLFAYEEWLLIVCFWVYFIGASIGTYEDTHINADLLGSFLRNPKALWIRNLCVTGIEFFIACCAVYWSVIMIFAEFDEYPYWNTTIALKIPFVVPRLAIAVGFSFMAFYSLLKLYVTYRASPTITHKSADYSRPNNQAEVEVI